MTVSATNRCINLPSVGDLTLPENLSDKEVERISRELLQAFDKSHTPTTVDKERVLSLVPDPGSKDGLLIRYISKMGTGQVNGELRLDPKHIEVQHTVPSGPPTDQKSSGRCWIFAWLNTMRSKVLNEYGDDFEYSQNYTAFWDKVERANYFLEKMIEFKDRDPNDAAVSGHLSDGYGDGGWSPYFGNLIDKYGVVPKSAMPETSFSGNSSGYMRILNTYLREVGCVLHKKARDGADRQELEELKQKALDEVCGVLMKYLGTPPKSFLWKDKEGNFVSKTPLEFRAENPTDFSQMIEVSDFPHYPRGAILELPHEGNRVDGQVTRFLNVGMDVMKDAIRASIKDGASVWFGSDVNDLETDHKIFTTDWNQANAMLGLTPPEGLTKADRLLYQAQGLSHAMAFVGCDDPGHRRLPEELSDNVSELYKAPVWQIENSWDGLNSLLASDAWLNRHLYTVVVDRKYLPQSVQDLWDNPFTKRIKLEEGGL